MEIGRQRIAGRVIVAGFEFDPRSTALVLVDLQNDFLHPEGAYGRAGAGAAAIAALPARLKPVADAMRSAGGWIISTHFTLVPGRRGEPFISDHLRRLRPFLAKGDFLPGSFGHALVTELQPADLAVEKVAFSAFYQSRLEFVLRNTGIGTLVFAGIVTNGGVESTVRDAHVRDFRCAILSDGCAAFSESVHQACLTSLGTVGTLLSCAELSAALAKAARPG
jgi:ureidoacrylate peracid hydrolase